MSQRYTCTRCMRQLSQLPRGQRTPSNVFQRHIPAVPSIRSTASHLHTSPARPAKVRGTTRESFAKARFSRTDVPPREFWAAQARPPLVADLTADECQRAAHQYADLALEDAADWRQKRLKPANADGNADGKDSSQYVSYYTLHYIATMITLGPRGPAWHLATHIFHTLTQLGYEPSVLTLARLGLRTGNLHLPHFRPAVDALDRSLRSRRGSADACTLKAMMCMAQETREGDDEALRWFRKAFDTHNSLVNSSTSSNTDLSANSDDQDAKTVDRVLPQHWQWQTSFALGTAAIRARRGETDKARELYRFAARDLDNAKGCYELAQLLDDAAGDHPERRELLEKAAVSGVDAACRELGVLERERAAAGLGSRKEREEARVLAEEWAAIAGDRAAL
ncbi:Uu.00g001130.m01.CDS01 [Anthostomella pinea]|uniref:Uu.00g001130.m01.CDS01 n=1 Tax=Anthostomella pinea TaxID=933095 RepID=A0AAI8YG31_9PEZI|nr:Uu.00g001130.m01.CDS01 [Anthostomella pinea]